MCEGGSPPSTGRSDCRKPLSPHPLFRRPSRSVSVDSETGPVSVSQLIPAPSSRYCLRYRVATLRTLALHLRPRFPNEFIGKGSNHMTRRAAARQKIAISCGQIVQSSDPCLLMVGTSGPLTAPRRLCVFTGSIYIVVPSGS